MSPYSLVIDKAQKELIAKALESFSYLLQGQTGSEMESAKRMAKILAKSNHSPTIILTAQE